MLGASMGVVEYHLYVLEKEKKIVSRRTGLYKRFYPALSFGEKDQEILGVLSQETERDILLYVLENPRVTQSDVSGYMQISAASVIWHMKRLIGAGLIEAKREGHYVVYRVDRDRDGILRLLRTYHPGVWETWANRLGDILTDISEQ
jgi:predicted transcriptional regulator